VIASRLISSFQPAFPLPAGRKGWGLGKETTPPTPSPKKPPLFAPAGNPAAQREGKACFSNTSAKNVFLRSLLSDRLGFTAIQTKNLKETEIRALSGFTADQKRPQITLRYQIILKLNIM